MADYGNHSAVLTRCTDHPISVSRSFLTLKDSFPGITDFYPPVSLFEDPPGAGLPSNLIRRNSC